MHFDEFLGEMQKLLTASQQGSLFGNKEAHGTKAAKACVEYLKALGYSVGPPNNFPIKISKLDELIEQFYWLVRSNYDEHLWNEPNRAKDRKIAKSFIESRMKDNCVDKQTAMNQCSFIIETIFKHKNIFKFESPPNFGILGQGEMSWVTERAIRILNKAITEDLKVVEERRIEVLDKEIEKNYPKLGHNLSELEAMQKKLEDQYGKKENC